MTDEQTSNEMNWLPDAAELEAAVARGEMTREQAAEQLQQAQRRHVAETGPDDDTDAAGLITESGFGSGQGMASHSGKSGKRDT
ncbi:MAG TPA: hypothetical protein VGR16_08610 [Thermomicrobiales bacterium]|nr:hypothetical protein [Thermomicrobiales bacterium]